MSVVTDRSGRLPRSERRVQLLDAAREAFVQQGYHAAGMDGIAELAGVSKPVLYQHFPGKLELYLAVLDESSDSLIERVRLALDSTSENRKRVRATFEAYFDFVAHESGAFRLIFESDLTNVPEAASRVRHTNEVCATLIAEVIREDTQLHQEDAMLLAMGLLGMAQTSARHWLHSPAPISQESAARAMSALAWRGISGFPLSAHPTAATIATTSQAAVPTEPSPATAPVPAEPASAASTVPTESQPGQAAASTPESTKATAAPGAPAKSRTTATTRTSKRTS